MEALGVDPADTVFEDIDRSTGSTNHYWRGTDGRAGNTTPATLSTAMLDGAVRRIRAFGQRKPSFWIGDPAVIDAYAQSLYNLTRWAGQTGVLATGFEGISYRGTILVGDYQMERGTLVGVDKDAIQMYGYQPGPDFLDDDGGQFRRFQRSLPKEFDLVDFYQAGYLRVNTHVYLRDLSRAA